MQPEVLIQRLTKRNLYSVVQKVCSRHHVTPHELLGRRRTQNVARARHALFHALVVGEGLSTPEAGALLDYDHTTVLHGVKMHRLRLEQEQQSSIAA